MRWDSRQLCYSPRMRLLCVLTSLFFSIPLVAGKLQVVTTHTVLTDLVSVIAADRVQVNCLLPINLDPHSYEPKPADIRLLSQADLVIVNGLGLELWAEKVIANSGFRGRMIKAAETIPHPLPATGHEHAGTPPYPDDHFDPHAWHNPKNVEHYVLVIRDALSKAVPEEAEYFRANALRYLGELQAADHYARAQFDTLPPNHRKLVTSHDSLQYLANTYGLTIVPVAGTRPDQEPSARQLAELIKFIRKQNVRAVFFEATTRSKLVELVAKEAGVSVVGELYTDSLGPAGLPGATYLGMLRSNVDTLVSALK